jgi:membrane fusion protein, multidrug efflux system
MGRVREVSPQADPVTRTFQVRVGLANPPSALRLGSSVTGKIAVAGSASGMEIPASALTRSDGQPAVWVVDPAVQRVALRNIDLIAHELDSVLVEHGLTPGELVVTAGVQTLRPNQQVRLLGVAPPPPVAAPEDADGGADAPAAGEPADAAAEPAADEAAQ